MTKTFTRLVTVSFLLICLAFLQPAMAADDLRRDEVRVFPNPFTTEATIRLSSQLDFNVQKVSFQIFNLVGEVVYKVPMVKTSEIKINREPFVRGMYFYQLNIDGKVVTTGKITVK